MNAADFRRLALGMKDAVEGAHMGHPDFRIHGKIFATLHADDRFGMVTLTPDDQQAFTRDHPGAFAPESGAWGRAGCTRVQLDAVDVDALGEAMTIAWQHIASKQPGPGRKAAAKRKQASPKR